MTIALIIFIVIALVELGVIIYVKKNTNDAETNYINQIDSLSNQNAKLVKDLEESKTKLQNQQDKLEAFEVTYSELDKRYTQLQKECNKAPEIKEEVKEEPKKVTRKKTTKKVEEKKTTTRTRKTTKK